MLSTSCKYALRACVFLAARSSGKSRYGIREIAAEIEANEHTAGKILQQLVREGLIHSAKGPGGGFFMDAQAPVSLLRIVQVVDGTELFTQCGLGLKQCSEQRPCPIHDQYKEAREALLRQFSTLTVQDLAADYVQGKAFLKR
ncbi:MAG TPA: Rrf2 family transcriptional regulator [Chitinophagaceae bacterium]|nr:Rrf2 family transcriptional regulator [Chitinophagaceae bacterium]